MLKVYQVNEKVNYFRHVIRVIGDPKTQAQQEYIDHLKRLMVAYDLEGVKARIREVKDVKL